MGVRSILLSLFVALIAPSYANALDIFQFFDNALNGRNSKPVLEEPDNSPENEDDEDWSNSIVIDLRPKPAPAPAPLPPQPMPLPTQPKQSAQTKAPQQVPAPVPPSQRPIPQPRPQPLPEQNPAPVSRPVPQSLPTPQPLPVPQPLPAPVKSPTPISTPAPQPIPQGRYEVKRPEIFKEEVLEKNLPSPEWKDDKRAHWEFELINYYSRYLGGEASMARLERETKLHENALFFDPSKARSLDPNKYLIPLNGVNGGKWVTDLYTRTWKSYEFVLCPISRSVGNSLSAQGKIDVHSWNRSFGSLAGGSGLPIVRRFNSESEFNAGIESMCKQAGVKNCNDEFKNAVKSSASQWDEQNHSEQVESSRQVDSKTRVKWRLEPLIYFNLDFEKKVVNLTPYVNDVENAAPIPSARQFVGAGNAPMPATRIPLKPASPSYGYDIYQSRTLGLGGGVGIQSVIDWSSPSWAWLKQAGVFAGGMITKNETRGSARRVEPTDPTPEQLREMMAKVTEVQAVNHYGKIPNGDIRTQFIYPVVGNIKNWKIGESYHYTLRGGFMLTGGVHWMAVAMGPTFVKEGSAGHIVTKVGEDKVMVEVTDMNVVSGSAALAAGILSFSEVMKNNISRVKETYFYDLSMPAGHHAFTQLMLGNYYDTQFLIAQNQTVAVALVERDVTKTYLDRDAGDFMSSWYVGIPFIYWNWMWGKTTDEGLLQNFIDSLETRYYHGMYFDNHHRRVLFDHKYVTSAFYSGIEHSAIMPMRRSDNQDFYGRYLWNFQDESPDRKTLRKQLNKMIYFQTGLEELEVDESAIKKDDIGYINAEVIMDFNREVTGALFGALQGTELKRQYDRAVDQFKKTEYPEDLDYCDTFEINGYRGVYSEGHPHYQNKRLAKEECSEFIRKKFMPVIEEMKRKLVIMEEKTKRTDDESKKEFAQLYREFGRLMMTNRFTFRAVYNYLAEVDVGDFVRYTINGESVANMVIYFPSGKVGRPTNLINR